MLDDKYIIRAVNQACVVAEKPEAGLTFEPEAQNSGFLLH